MSYRKGSAFEYRIKKHLEAQGYFVVRSAGSHGIADLVAFKFGETLFIQAKANALILNYQEWNQLVKLTREVGGSPIHALKLGTRLIYRKLHGYRGPRAVGSFSPFDPNTLDVQEKLI